MLILEEDRLGKGKKVVDNSSSSTKALNVAVTPNDRSSQQQPHHFGKNRGNRGRGGSRGRGRNNSTHPRAQFNQWGVPYWNNGYPMWNSQQFNPWTQFPQPAYAQPGLLGPRPQPQHTPVNAADQKNAPTADFASAYNTMTLFDPSDNQWYMDSGATAHLSNSAGNLHSVFKNNIGKTVTVANGGRIPVTFSGSRSFLTKSRPLSLNSVLVTPLL